MIDGRIAARIRMIIVQVRMGFIKGIKSPIAIGIGPPIPMNHWAIFILEDVIPPTFDWFDELAFKSATHFRSLCEMYNP
jgi:hypothetical protein